MNEESQWVRAYSSADNTVLGQTNPYQILDHAPNDFALQTPVDDFELKLKEEIQNNTIAQEKIRFDCERKIATLKSQTSLQLEAYEKALIEYKLKAM